MASILHPTTPISPGVAQGTARRLAIVASCALAGAGAFALGDPAPRLAADPELAQLLRGMAMLKALLAAVALSVVLWRVGVATINPMIALGYGAAVTFMIAATVMVWQLSYLQVTSLGFHAGLITLLLFAWFDDGLAKGALRRRS